MISDFPTPTPLPDLSPTTNTDVLSNISDQNSIDDYLDDWSSLSAFETNCLPWDIALPDWDSAHLGSDASLPSSIGTPSALLWQACKASTLVDSHTFVTPYDQAMVHILAQYPQMMLDRDNPPPFFHPLYSYEVTSLDIPEPLATALCCVNACNVASANSRIFVNRLIDTERERLVRQFVS
jgi:hypothetical protein